MATAGTARSAAAAEEDKSEPARPLALPSPTVHPAGHGDAEAAAQAATGWRSGQYLRKRRRCVLCCCGCCVTTVVVVGLVVLVLALTVFRVKDPRITMNRVALAAISAGPGQGAGQVATNATLTADVSIKNPNVASMRFSRSETDVYLKGQTVSVAYAPAGRVGADRTVRMNLTVDLLGDRLAQAMNGGGGGGLLFGQQLELTTYTEINGTVKVLGIYKKDLEIRMNCSIIIEVGGVATLLSGAASGVQSKGLSCVGNVS